MLAWAEIAIQLEVCEQEGKEAVRVMYMRSTGFQKGGALNRMEMGLYALN